MMRAAGFSQVELVAQTGLNSSPSTRGVLIRAGKPRPVSQSGDDLQDPLQHFQRFFDQAYAPGALGGKTKHLVALAASLAAGCEP